MNLRFSLKYNWVFLYTTPIIYVSTYEVTNNIIIKMSKIRFTNIKNGNTSLDALYTTWE